MSASAGALGLPAPSCQSGQCFPSGSFDSLAKGPRLILRKVRLFSPQILGINAPRLTLTVKLGLGHYCFEGVLCLLCNSDRCILVNKERESPWWGSLSSLLFNLQLKLITKQSCHTVPYGLSVYGACTVLTYGHASQDATVTCSPFVGTY